DLPADHDVNVTGRARVRVHDSKTLAIRLEIIDRGDQVICAQVAVQERVLQRRLVTGLDERLESCRALRVLDEVAQVAARRIDRTSNPADFSASTARALFARTASSRSCSSRPVGNPTLRPFGDSDASQANGHASGTARSYPSGPAIAWSTMAQSSTVRHIGPILSSVQPAAMTPRRLTRPNVGRRPTTPQRTDGDRIDPPVSLPIAKPTRPAAVAAPDPADDPLEPSEGFHGLFVRPPNHSSPNASSPVVSFATSTAPASVNRRTTSASSSITRFSYGAAPHVVGYPRAAMMSFTPNGMPWSGPRYRPAANSRSRSRAVSSARSRVRFTTQLSVGL